MSRNIMQSIKKRVINFAGNDRGFTIIELLISIGITALVSASLFTIYQSQQDTFIQQGFVRERNQNVRVAMDWISKDLRMAGYMVNNSSGLVAFNSSVEADEIYISDYETIAPGTLATAIPLGTTLANLAVSGSTTLQLTSLDIDNDGASDFTVEGGLIISDGTNTEGFRIDSIVGMNITISGTPNTSTAGRSLVNNYATANTTVMPAIRYTVDTSTTFPSLRRNNDILTEGIEDVQIAFGRDTTGNGTVDIWLNNANVTGTQLDADVKSVRISVVGRTSKADQGLQRVFNQTLEDRTMNITDDYRRLTLDNQIVRLRNF